MNILRTIAAAALLSLSAPVATGCSAADANEAAEARGGLELIASTASALTADTVSLVEVRLFGPALPAGFRTFHLTRGAGTWFGRLDQLPPGAYTIEAQAFDANGGLTFQGRADGVIVQPPIDTYVNLNLRQVQPDAPFQNSAPFVTFFAASKRVAQPGETITVHASASDSESDAITYAWTASRGVITSQNGMDAQWTAPPDGGPVELTLTVDDGRGAVSIARLPLEVGVATGAIAFNATFISAPRVLSMSLSNGQPRVGDVIHVDALVEALQQPYCGSYYDPSCFAGFHAIWTSDCGNLTSTGPGPLPFPGGPTVTDVTITTTAPECTVRLDLLDPASGVANFGVVTVRPVAPTLFYDVP